MARSRSPDSIKAEEMYHSGMSLADIANRIGKPEGTVRRWKSTQKWDGENENEHPETKANVRIESERARIESERSETKTNARKEAEKEADTEATQSVMENPDLTDKQRLFCLHYAKSFNATKAYQKAYGCSYETAASNGYRMLRNARVKNEIQKLKQNRMNRELLDESDVFQKYMDIAFADITDYLEFGTEEVPVMAVYGPVKVKDRETGEEKMLTKTVNMVRFRNSSDVDGTILAEVKQGKDGASIKLSDRMKALDWIANHMDLATEEQRARIAALKAKTQDEEENIQDDGFIDALKGMASEVWEE